eukprot:1918130-Rhodomonas_salina.3
MRLTVTASCVDGMCVVESACAFQKSSTSSCLDTRTRSATMVCRSAKPISDDGCNAALDSACAFQTSSARSEAQRHEVQFGISGRGPGNQGRGDR